MNDNEIQRRLLGDLYTIRATEAKVAASITKEQLHAKPFDEKKYIAAAKASYVATQRLRAIKGQVDSAITQFLLPR